MFGGNVPGMEAFGKTGAGQSRRTRQNGAS